MVRAVDTEQQPVENFPTCHFIMYPSRQAMEVRVIRAEDHAGMSHRFPLVQPQEVETVLRQEHSSLRGGKL